MKAWLATQPPTLPIKHAQHLKEMAKMPCLQMMHHVHGHRFGPWTQRLLIPLYCSFTAISASPCSPARRGNADNVGIIPCFYL